MRTLAGVKAGKLEAFICCVEQELVQKFVPFGPGPESAWSIGFSRYDEALSTSEEVEKRITLAIMALEALLSEQANSYRLAMRAGALLGALGADSARVADQVRSGYSVRNRYVHGDIARRDASTDFDRLSGEVLETVRKCLVYTLVFKHADREGKPALLRDLDEYLLNHDRNVSVVVNAARIVGIL